MFPEIILNMIYDLRRHYQGTRTCVTMNYPTVEIIVLYNHHETSLKLFYYPISNSFEIQPLDALHNQKISFFDYRSKERRWIRNKKLLFSIIKNLKICGLWDLVSNKDFLVVNEDNNRVNISDRIVLLQQIIKPVDKK
jgi:hypothetical protein